MRPIRAHGPHLHPPAAVALEGQAFAVRRPDRELVCERRFMSGEFVGGAAGIVDDPDVAHVVLSGGLDGQPASVRRPCRTLPLTLVSVDVSQLPRVRAIRVHDVDMQDAARVSPGICDHFPSGDHFGFQATEEPSVSCFGCDPSRSVSSSVTSVHVPRATKTRVPPRLRPTTRPETVPIVVWLLPSTSIESMRLLSFPDTAKRSCLLSADQ